MLEKLANAKRDARSHTPVVDEHGYTDLPTDNDALNANNFCEGIAEFIETCDTPMTIAIQGDWGTGKSTAIRLIQRELDRHNSKHSDARIAYATLDTWQYSTLQQEGLLPTYLLVSMYNSILECTNQGCQPEEIKQQNIDTRKFLVRLLRDGAKGTLQFIGNATGAVPVVNIGALLLNEFLGDQNPESDAGKSPKVAALKDNEPIKLPAELVKEKISELIDQAIIGSVKTEHGTKNEQETVQKVERIVLFIDELDRLKPETAFELLEAMKNFFDCKHCVFVLAVDRDVVYRGIEIKYKDAAITRQKKQQFFDKIIQLPFNLPTSQYSTPQYFQRLLKRYGTTEDEAKTYNNLFVSILQTHNPRSIKRILNLWDLYQLIYKQQKYDTQSRQMLFGALVLQTKEDQNRIADDADTAKLDKPYSDLVKAAQDGEDSLKDVLLKAYNSCGAIHTFAQKLGIYQNEEPSSDESDGSDGDDGSNEVSKLDESKVDTLQTLLTSLSEMFSASSVSTSDVIYELSDNRALEELCNYLQANGCKESRVAKERYDYWKNDKRHNSINGTVSLRDNLQRKANGKTPREGDEVHIVFRFDTGEAKAVPDYTSLQTVVGEILPEITNRQFVGRPGQKFATLTGINRQNFDRVEELLGRFLGIK